MPPPPVGKFKASYCIPQATFPSPSTRDKVNEQASLRIHNMWLRNTLLLSRPSRPEVVERSTHFSARAWRSNQRVSLPVDFQSESPSVRAAQRSHMCNGGERDRERESPGPVFTPSLHPPPAVSGVIPAVGSAASLSPTRRRCFAASKASLTPPPPSCQQIGRAHV